ncbi:MAG TPA: hypothetical protein VE988_20515 [Gemmataceae bacterium]|nr:hypothetical protein [Gemmataceae bacterium]
MSTPSRQPLNAGVRCFVGFGACVGLVTLGASGLSAQPPAKGAQGDLPKIVFNPKRPIPEPPGDVRNIESLTKPPPGYTSSKRNNFYKKEGGKQVPGTDLYRWANSGHWTNYDLAEIGVYKLPDPLLMGNGSPVNDAETWLKQRRPEIVKIVETEFYGTVPANAPKVVWKVTSNTNDGTVIRKTIVGTLVGADGSPAPAGGGKGGKGGGGGNTITITLVLPAGAGKVPVFFGGLSQQECLSMGWGYGSISSPTGTLINMTSPPKGQPKPGDFWGNYRIVAWCFSRAIDYLETDPDVDARYICISGHSTGGKQVLCTAALEPRIFMVVPTSSGRMGAAIIRRDFGESLDDQAQLYAQNYCANVKKWVGRWNDMPFDSHYFIALVAPRLCYITGGTQELWVDAKGQFEACVAADPVYKLLGKTGLGTKEMPKADVAVVNGELGFYMHTGGHTFTAAEHKSVMEWGAKYMPSKKKASGK